MKALASIVLILLATPLLAQTFPEKDEGTVIYYRIVSAAADYGGHYYCLEDIKSDNREFNFAVKPYDVNVKQQDWSLIARDAENETYNLYNRENRRYVSTKMVAANNMLTLYYRSSKLSTDALKFTSLGNGQYAISFLNDGEEYFLAANDLNAPTYEMPETLNNTIWAWSVYTSDELAAGIESPVELSPQISVRNRCIVVSGTDQWQVVDMQGRQMPRHTSLQPGLYIVTTPKLNLKVQIK